MLANLFLFSWDLRLGFAKTIIAQKLSGLSFGELLLVSLFGFSLVFFVLLALQAIIKLIAKSRGTQQAVEAAPATPCSASTEQKQSHSTSRSEKAQLPARGSQGELALHGVDPRTAALLMAIVAEHLQKPLNRLRFISIQEASAETKTKQQILENRR